MLHGPIRLGQRPPVRRFLPPLSATATSAVLVAVDTVSILGAGYVTFSVLITHATAAIEFYAAAVLFVWLTTLMLMHFAGLYQFEVASHPLRYVLPLLIAIGTAFLFLLAAAFSLKVSETFSRTWMVAFAASSVASICLTRTAAAFAIARLIGTASLRRSMAIVGLNEQSTRLLHRLTQGPFRPISVHGVFVDQIDELVNPPHGDLPSGAQLQGDLEALVREARSGAIDDVVIALPWSEDDRIMGLVAKLRELPINVYLASDLVGFRTEFQGPPGHFGDLPIVQLVGKPMSGWDAVFKLIEDYLLAAVLVVLLAPLMILVALAIKLESRGPILFRQKRLGFNNQVFDVYKFRSMHPDDGPTEKTVQAGKDDPRTTNVGRLIRRWSLDELPQLFNVLNGTMSLVGPRPHALDHNEDFARQIRGYFARHRVKPGITGLAQVKGYRGLTDTPEKIEGRIRNDFFYVDNWSLSMDVRILLQTIVICLVGKNAH